MLEKGQIRVDINLNNKRTRHETLFPMQKSLFLNDSMLMYLSTHIRSYLHVNAGEGEYQCIINEKDNSYIHSRLQTTASASLSY